MVYLNQLCIAVIKLRFAYGARKGRGGKWMNNRMSRPPGRECVCVYILVGLRLLPGRQPPLRQVCYWHCLPLYLYTSDSLCLYLSAGISLSLSLSLCLCTYHTITAAWFSKRVVHDTCQKIMWIVGMMLKCEIFTLNREGGLTELNARQ